MKLETLVLAIGLVALVALAACSSSGAGSPTAASPGAGPACTEGEPGCVGWRQCPAEFEPDPAGAGCREIAPADACPAGTMAELGQRACVPVGPAACASGFRKAASGWGCEPILPAAICSGATREELGRTACVPVGDCDAAFPPPQATYFVNAAFTDAEIGPKRFRTVREAVDAAPSGAVIAVDSGRYAEGIEASTPVTIVGRCAERVRLVGTGKDVWGVLANGVKNVSVRGVTLEDHYEGARAQSGGTITLTDVVIESPRGSGLVSYRSKSSIVAERVVIRGTRPQPGKSTQALAANADAGGAIRFVSSAIEASWHAGVTATNPGDENKETSTIELLRTVVRDTNVTERSPVGAGVVVSDYSKGTIHESAIVRTRRIATAALGPEARLTISGSVIASTLPDKSGEAAAGVYAAEGAQASLDGVTLRDVSTVGLFSIGAKTRVTATRAAVEGTTPGPDGDFGMGAWADQGGRVELDSVALVGNAYYGFGLYGAGTTGKLARVLVAGTRRNKLDQMGRGVNVEYGASLDFDRVTVTANGDSSFFVRGQTKDGARAQAKGTRLFVTDTVSRADGSLGDGLDVEKGAIAEIDGAAIVRARRAGVLVNDTLGDAGDVAELTLSHTVVRDTRAADDGLTGKGIALQGVGIGVGGKLALRSSAVTGSVEFGLVVGNATGSATVESSFIGSTRPDDSGQYGHGAVATGKATLIMRSTEVRANRIGIAFNDAAGVVTRCLVAGNAVGIHVQEGSTIETGKTAPEAASPRVVVVTDDSRFEQNQTKVGSGAVPLPSSPVGGAGEAGGKPKKGL